MKFRALAGFGLILFLLPLALFSQSTDASLVRFHTNLGNIDVQLLPNAAPQTVANFLKYMNRGSYDNSVIHRSVSSGIGIFQGGGYQLQNHMLVAIPADAAIPNEFSVSNKRGTIAMALTGSAAGTDVNSATTQWFFNYVDNSASLDPQFFTVFGRVNDAASLAVMGTIAAVPVPNPGPLASPFNQIPLMNFGGGTVQDSNYVLVNSISALLPLPAISPSGIITASNFGGYSAAAAGSFIEIYGSNLAGTTRTWAGSDFTNGAAPTSLDDVSVTIDGLPAFIYFVSPSQVNVQVPAGVRTFVQVPVVLTYKGETSASMPLAIRPYEGGLLAPQSFNVNGKQYIEAFHSATGAVVNTASPAMPGEIVLFYGVGFGPVAPGTIPVAGQVVPGQNSLVNPLQIMIGQSVATVRYMGLVPSFIGLYQFNVVVPSNLASGDQPIAVTLGSPAVGVQTLPQMLYLPVGQ